MAKLYNSQPREQTRWGLPLALALAAMLPASCGKRVDPAPKPQAPPPFEFLDAWGDKGEGPGKLDEPVAFAVDVLGNVFFADPGAGFVHKFESKGTPLLSFEDTRLHRASGIAVDSGGAIYVADAEHGSVLIFFPDGTFYRARQVASQPHFSGPLGISVDITGHLYVPDPAHSRIAKFDPQGRLVKSWAVPKDAGTGRAAVGRCDRGGRFGFRGLCQDRTHREIFFRRLVDYVMDCDGQLGGRLAFDYRFCGDGRIRIHNDSLSAADSSLDARWKS